MRNEIVNYVSLKKLKLFANPIKRYTLNDEVMLLCKFFCRDGRLYIQV